MLPVREGLYKYHRLGMDGFTSEPDKSRKAILETLQSLQKVNRIKPNSILIISFFDAKSDELTDIFSKGSIGVRRQAYDILKDLDPTKTEKYSKMIAN